MERVTQHQPAANESGLSARLTRDIGLHRAAQTLADATRCRTGLTPLPLTQLDPRDREWFRQTARHLVEIFETITQPDRELDADREERERAERRAESTAADQARRRGSATGARRGHTLGAWLTSGVDSETAACVHCGRSVTIDLSPATWFRADSLAGSALTSGCLTPAQEPGA